MSLSSRFVVFWLLVPAIALAGSQSWEKESTRWSAKDAERILNGSPWMQGAAVTFPEPERDVPQAPLPGASAAGMAGGSAATQPRWDGNGGPIKDSTPPTLSVAVRWDSALPVRLAQEKTHEKDGLLLSPETAAKNYVVTVMGLVPARSYRQRSSPGISASDNSSDVRNPQNTLESFMSRTALSYAGKLIRPEDVKLDAETGHVHFYFPRDPGLDKKVKEIRFRTIYGSLSVDKTFRTRDMLYLGKLEL